MDNEIKGISFPFRIGGRGGVTMSGRTPTIQQHLKECLEVLLGTREGERVMRPYNGLEELDIFFNDLNETTKNMAIFKINEKVQQLEPRVAITDIEIYPQDQVDGSIAHIVDITYEETDSGTIGTLSMNF